MAVDKKWYSYFVVTDDRVDPADPSAEVDAAPQRVSDAFPDAGAEAALPAAPAVASTNLGAVYDAAKIAAPAHGYTVLKVAEMLQSEHIRSLPAEVKRKSVMVALDAAGVKVADVVEDAVRRDRALDTYERVLLKSLEDLRAQTSSENKQIEDEITQRVAELRARIDENNKRTKSRTGRVPRLAGTQTPGRRDDRRGGELLRVGESDHDEHNRQGQRRRRCSLG